MRYLFLTLLILSFTSCTRHLKRFYNQVNESDTQLQQPDTQPKQPYSELVTGTKKHKTQPLDYSISQQIEEKTILIKIHLTNTSSRKVIIPYRKWLYFDLGHNELLPFGSLTQINCYIIFSNNDFPTEVSECWSNLDYLFCCILPNKELIMEFSIPKSVLNDNGKLILVTVAYAELTELQETHSEFSKLLYFDRIQYFTIVKGWKCGNFFFNKNFNEKDLYNQMEIDTRLIPELEFKLLKLIPDSTQINPKAEKIGNH
ncbi:hypothetical protein QNI16_24960 [Cytophagaceae bacterium YF14B1]|uniref:Lipoprotein n=1 Tax=Xanthocytophaga flava TaxID=3048013 RepID=A0AAE3QVX4_9BACT|nr:hypothetical protein [Xanthocytophaga flavus]MDJ1483774.1 hypothetical protein [Xanthocytophaga flavus]